jgi:hypothetical protein
MILTEVSFQLRRYCLYYFSNIRRSGQSGKNRFLFFKGITNANTIASPDDADANTIVELKLSQWTNKNQTRFNPTTITDTQFDAIGDTYQFPTFNLMQQTTKMNNLITGQVFLFKTKNDKLGLVKVIDLYNRGDRAKVSVIVQK